MSGRSIKCLYFWNMNQLVFRQCFEHSMMFFMPHIELIPIKLRYEAQTSDFGTMDFRQLMLEKVREVKEYVFKHMHENLEIIISDIDIIVYENFQHLLSLGPDEDMILQAENSEGNINTGFIYMRCSEKTYNFWKHIEDEMVSFKSGEFVNEQAIVNRDIRSSELKWRLFESSIWAYSNEKPSIVYLHHANHTPPSTNVSSYQLKCQQFKWFLEGTNSPIKKQLLDLLNS